MARVIPADPRRQDVRNLALGYELGLDPHEAERRAMYRVAELDWRDEHGLDDHDLEGYNGWRRT